VARLLQVDVGSALLAVQRLVFDANDRPVQWLQGLYRPDRYQYEMQLSRVGGIDAKLFVTAILVQRESGGTLSEVLLGLAGVVRERAALRERVATLTAEPRASARVLGLLPIVCFALLFVLDPAFVRPMVTTTLGHLLLAYAALSVTVGYLLLSRFARIEF